jgi:hypothetical protein
VKLLVCNIKSVFSQKVLLMLKALSLIGGISFHPQEQRCSAVVFRGLQEEKNTKGNDNQSNNSAHCKFY